MSLLPKHLINLAKGDLESLCVDCGLCLSPDTRILYADMSWRRIGDACIGDELLAFDENAVWRKSNRKLRTSTVEYVHWANKPTRRLITDEQEIVTTTEHRWLTSRGWKETSRLIPSAPLRSFGVHVGPQFSGEYKLGYLAGMTEGDGTFRFDSDGRRWWRVALKDAEPIGRLVRYLNEFGISVNARPFVNSATSFSPGDVLTQVGFTQRAGCQLVKSALLAQLTPEYSRGFLAGLFDAEGCFSGRSLSISQHGTRLLDRAIKAASQIGLLFYYETHSHPHPEYRVIRLKGGLQAHLQFFQQTCPAIVRKRGAFFGKSIRTDPTPVRVVDGHTQDVVDIQTSTATFIAEGMATHNCCYASAQLGKGQVLVPELRCKHLNVEENGKSCCSVYETRHEVAKGWCLPLAEAIQKGVFPDLCPYVRDMQDYVGSAVLSEDAYSYVRPQLQKSIMDSGKPSWVSDQLWAKFLSTTE